MAWRHSRATIARRPLGARALARARSISFSSTWSRRRTPRAWRTCWCSLPHHSAPSSRSFPRSLGEVEQLRVGPLRRDRARCRSAGGRGRASRRSRPCPPDRLDAEPLSGDRRGRDRLAPGSRNSTARVPSVHRGTRGPPPRTLRGTGAAVSAPRGATRHDARGRIGTRGHRQRARRPSAGGEEELAWRQGRSGEPSLQVIRPAMNGDSCPAGRRDEVPGRTRRGRSRRAGAIEFRQPPRSADEGDRRDVPPPARSAVRRRPTSCLSSPSA